MSVVSYKNTDAIAVITVNNPPVNVLSQAVRQGILSAVNTAVADDSIQAIVLICAGRTFIAGADIKEFALPNQEPSLPDVVMVIHDCEKPIVAAIHGTALGGGFEIAMACQYRIALTSAQVGLPEVKLGLIPGAGGTQLLPRLIGVEAASDVILNSKRLKAPMACELGAIDKIVEDNLLDVAIIFAHISADKTIVPTGDRSIELKGDANEFFETTRRAIAKKTRGFIAPQCALKAIEAAMTEPLEKGMQRERELFQQCRASPQAKALQHLFFAERKARMIPDLPRDLPLRDIKSVGIIGAGTMGGGIAMSFANANIPVTILDMNKEALDAGLSRVRANYNRSVKSGRMTSDQLEKSMASIHGTISYDDLQECDLIIEAAVEKMEIKETIFKKLDQVSKPGAILASNTSYLDIDHLAQATKRPQDVVGLHFFSPANIMKLLEIVRGKETAPDVIATVLQLAKVTNKIGVVSGVCHGFIGNRMLSCYGREACLTVMEGAAPSQVDKALYSFGMAMGPLTVYDMAGLDIGYMNRKSAPKGMYDEVAYEWLNRLVEMDRKGLKSGAGIYRYDAGDRTPIDDELVDKIIDEEALKSGLDRKACGDEEIVERCMLTLINEGAKILEEGIALRSSDIDLVYCNGYGFPAYRGGPMHYADQLGLGHVVERLTHIQATRGERWWKISPLIQKLATDGMSFSEYDKSQEKI